MKQFVLIFVLFIMVMVLPVQAADDTEESPKYALLIGKIITCADGPIDNGTILVSDGKIEAIGPRDEIEIPEGYKVIDHSRNFAMPGIIEGHSHQGSMMTDLNDSVYPTASGLRVVDQIRPYNDALQIGIQGGVTTILHIPGSGNNFSGFGVIMKTCPGTPEEVIVRFPGVMKISQAGNPERRSSGELGSGRAGMNWVLREKMRKGQAYDKAWKDYEEGRTDVKPEKDLQLEYMRPALNGEIPTLVHTQIFQVVMETVRMMGDEFNLQVILGHATFDGYKVGPAIVDRPNVRVLAGPRNTNLDREIGQVVGVVQGYYERGVRGIGVNTDSGVLPQEETQFQANIAVRYGWPEEAAVRGLTIEVAEMLMIDDRVGSLEVGKDADILIKDGPVMDLRSTLLKVFINGKVIYDHTRDRRIF
ncbi:MAG: amidohydrolase family protein [Planctomycetes bacterium]|nr:amidohydrolase family protein [Planctomycetota bacterium]